MVHWAYFPNNSIMTSKHFLPLLIVLVAALGCSNNQVGLSGKVVYSDTGEPVTQGEVQFYTPTFVARADIKNDGTFVTGSYKANDGLPPGTYGVAIASSDKDDNALIHEKFSDQATSGLTVTIDKTTRDLIFKVDRPDPAAARPKADRP